MVLRNDKFSVAKPPIIVQLDNVDVIYSVKDNYSCGVW